MAEPAAFHAFAQQAARWAGSSWMFAASVVGTVIWLALGPVLDFREAWHLWCTSGLTVTTWLLVVLIQHAQVTQEEAIQAKLDALIAAVDKADNRLIGIEKRPEEDSP